MEEAAWTRDMTNAPFFLFLRSKQGNRCFLQRENADWFVIPCKRPKSLPWSWAPAKDTYCHQQFRPNAFGLNQTHKYNILFLDFFLGSHHCHSDFRGGRVVDREALEGIFKITISLFTFLCVVVVQFIWCLQCISLYILDLHFFSDRQRGSVAFFATTVTWPCGGLWLDASMPSDTGHAFSSKLDEALFLIAISDASQWCVSSFLS